MGSPDYQIINGAQCDGYSWSQNHSDLEIQIELESIVESKNVEFKLKRNFIELFSKSNNKLFLSGKLYRDINESSAFWHVDNKASCLIVYVDKNEPSWWPKLLIDEKATLIGQKDYTISVADLDDPTRMVINKLMREQLQKMQQRLT